MNVTVTCPICTRAFAFDLRQAPVQRGGREGTSGWWKILAYYPDCPHCREKVEITELTGPLPDPRGRRRG